MKRMKTKKKNDELELVMGVCWYTPEEFIKMKQIASDKNRFEDTFKEWLEVAEKTLNDLKKREVNPRKVFVKTGSFRWWCENNSLAPDGTIRPKRMIRLLSKDCRPRLTSIPHRGICFN